MKNLTNTSVDTLLTQWELMGPGERRVFLTIGARLLAGQRRHGKLTAEKKDWTYEALEELMDSSVYMACALLDKVDKAFETMVDEYAPPADGPPDITPAMSKAAEIAYQEAVKSRNRDGDKWKTLAGKW